MSNRLIASADVSHRKLDLCFMDEQGTLLVPHQSFANDWLDYLDLRAALVQIIQDLDLSGLDVVAESTHWYWWHFPSTGSGRRFWQVAHDPELAVFDPRLFLVNPKLIKWFKKTFPEEEKRDERDPFFIGEYARTRRLTPYQFQEPVLPLRVYTRHHFHLVQSLARAKTYFLAYLFLKASAYQQLAPFADVFGVASRHILQQYPTLDQIAGFPTDALADHLQTLAKGTLPDPMRNATTLQQVAERSWPVPDGLVQPLQRILTLTLRVLQNSG